MREISFTQALDEAVAEEMRRDKRVITLGTDFTGNGNTVYALKARRRPI